MVTQPEIDEAKLESFMGKIIGDLGGTTATIMSMIGDRLGLFKDLADNGPATAAEIARDFPSRPIGATIEQMYQPYGDKSAAMRMGIWLTDKH